VAASTTRARRDGRRSSISWTVGREPLSGPLRLGVIPTLSPYLLPWLVPPLRKGLFQVAAHLSRSEDVRSARRWLAHHRLDAGILALPIHTPGIDKRTLVRRAVSGSSRAAAVTQLAVKKAGDRSRSLGGCTCSSSTKDIACAIKRSRSAVREPRHSTNDRVISARRASKRLRQHGRSRNGLHASPRVGPSPSTRETGRDVGRHSVRDAGSRAAHGARVAPHASARSRFQRALESFVREHLPEARLAGNMRDARALRARALDARNSVTPKATRE